MSCANRVVAPGGRKDCGGRLDAVTALELGREILDPALTPYGFTFVAGPPDPSGRGVCARGEYVRDNRRLALSFRESLGEVVYHVGDLSLPHEAYMAAVLGEPASNEYPGFSGDPLDSFRHLRPDLEHYAGVFLHGPDEHFRQIVARAARRPRAWGFRPLFRP
jgi:hypothetical protein